MAPPLVFCGRQSAQHRDAPVVQANRFVREERIASSGKKRGKNTTGYGNPYLARVLGNAAVSAGRTDTFQGERYRRIARRRGRKKAVVAIGRSLLVIIWHLLADPAARYTDLGSDFLRHPHQPRTPQTKPHPPARSPRLQSHPRTRSLTARPIKPGTADARVWASPRRAGAAAPRTANPPAPTRPPDRQVTARRHPEVRPPEGERRPRRIGQRHADRPFRRGSDVTPATQAADHIGG